MAGRAVLLLIALVGFSGCGVGNGELRNRIRHPGDIDYQQNRAQLFDPYPLNDVGPYIGGGRPMQYDIPAPENERAQNTITYQERYGHRPPPGLYHEPRATPAVHLPQQSELPFGQ